MHPLVKAFIGLLILVASLYYIFFGLTIPGVVTLKPALRDVLVVLNGAVPIFTALIGFFIIWLEYDEWKIEKELREEEEKAKRATRRKKQKKK